MTKNSAGSPASLLTVRELFALHFVAANIAAAKGESYLPAPSEAARNGVEYADALLAELVGEVGLEPMVDRACLRAVAASVIHYTEGKLGPLTVASKADLLRRCLPQSVRTIDAAHALLAELGGGAV